MLIESKQVEADGIGWRYHAVGTGPVGLLGFAGSLSGGPAFARVLSEAAPSHKIVVPEYAPVK